MENFFIHTDISSGGYVVSGTLYFYMFLNYTLGDMDKLSYDITLITPDRISVEVLFNIGKLTESLGILYFEKAKKGWNTKPIRQNGWACVEAKVEGLYVYGGESATPKDLVAWCQQLISAYSEISAISLTGDTQGTEL